MKLPKIHQTKKTMNVNNTRKTRNVWTIPNTKESGVQKKKC